MPDFKKLTDVYGSPLFIVDESKIRHQFNQIRTEFSKLYPNTEIAYAYKANYLLGICNLINELGGLAEVVSGFEYQIAKSIGVEGENMIVNGPYKPKDELRIMIQDGCIINVDNIEELELINDIASDECMVVEIGLRVNATIGKIPWSKFGFDVEGNDAFDAVCKLKDQFRNIDLKGIHIHIGTNIIYPWLYRKAIIVVLDFIKKIRDVLGIDIDYIDMGGGYPAKGACPANINFKDWSVPDIKDYAKAICEPLNDFYKDDDNRPRLILEPGRYLVDESMSLVTSVTSIKSIKGIRSIFVDAGVNILPSAYYRKHKIEAYTDCKEKELTDIYGALCMNVDLLEAGVILPKVKVGDILKINNAGAYEQSHSIQFSRLRPAVVSIRDDNEIVVIRRKERVEDIIRLER